MTVLKISDLNKGWGICGFASSLGALFQNSAYAKIINRAVNHNELNTRLLAEIKSYLVILQGEDNYLLLGEIERFTRSFGGVFSSFSIDKYIAKINQISSNAPYAYDRGYSIAMPPNALVDYLQHNCEMVNAHKIACRNSTTNNVILGLGDPAKAGNEWKGLVHWVYKKSDSEIYNHGEKVTIGALLGNRVGDPHQQVIYEIRDLYSFARPW
jgi:hypothetical protein